jgi:outer membrane protein W
MNRVKKMEVLSSCCIWLQFQDGFESEIDLQPFIGKGISKKLLKKKEFNKVSIESGGGLVWENGFDICPNFLRQLAEEKSDVISSNKS